jgi:hypothetical protein
MRAIVVVVVLAAITGCGGGSSGSGTGLAAGASITLSDNGNGALTVSGNGQDEPAIVRDSHMNRGFGAIRRVGLRLVTRSSRSPLSEALRQYVDSVNQD